MSLTIALVGNPNSGKTSLFNQLTGKNQSVGNWPGVTIEKKAGQYLNNQQITIVDLPGIYSLTPYSAEEVIARNFLLTSSVDVIINIVDATSLERSLYLTTQLLELGIPTIIALNMMDLVNKITHKKLDLKRFQTLFPTPIIPISALKRQGIKNLMQTALQQTPNTVINIDFYQPPVETKLQAIKQTLNLTTKTWRFFAVKYLENDEEILLDYPIKTNQQRLIQSKQTALETEFQDDIESIIADQRYQYITSICSLISQSPAQAPLSHSDKIDRIVTSRLLGFPIFILVMFSLYYLTVGPLGSFFTELIEDQLVPSLTSGISQLLTTLNVSWWLKGLLVDGLLAGIGTVVAFVPQIFILFFLISILEDTGYMARIAFILDRMFRKFGLSGKSFIPMLIGSGCSVPGIMATRTIESESDRKLTIMLTPFIICSAKLPIFTLLISALFPNQPWLLTVFYFTGIILIIFSGWLLKRLPYFKGQTSPFVMELPTYRWPQFHNVLKRATQQAQVFLSQASTVIFLASGIIWFLSSFNFNLQNVTPEASILANLGQALAFLFQPVGFGNWPLTVALLSGILAKETIVATLGILLGFLYPALPLVKALPLLITPLQAYSFLIFILFSAPCFSTMVATRREMGSLKWTVLTIAFQTGVAYLLSLLVYQLGSFWL